MKHIKKLFAFLLIALLVLSLGATAFADVTITINRDSSYDSGATGDRVYTYYQVFRATVKSAITSSGGGVDADGTPGDVTATPADGISYYLDATQDAALITKFEDNAYFKLTESADGSKYVVEWKNAKSDAETVQAAAKWIIDNSAYITSGPIAVSGATWTASVDEGYYVISGSEGANLVAATANISINEKNSYPTIDKKQSDTGASGYADDKVDVAIGDTIYYEVTVSIPADANKTITVTDAMTSGLTFNNDVAVNVGETGFTSAVSGSTVTLTPGDAVKGGDVVITYTATVNAGALADLGETARRNTATLNYNDHYTMSDYVEYTTYYTGIEKIDGSDDKPLKDVEFKLTIGEEEVKVKLGDDGVYVPDASGSSTVVTDEDGLIVIRGLDNDKTYTLTETKALDGYNLLDAPKDLTLIEDKAETAATDSFDQVENNMGTVLPSTGGIGTTIFYVIGGLMAAGAAVLLITKKRMGKEG